jgi:hypothetical protein
MFEIVSVLEPACLEEPIRTFLDFDKHVRISFPVRQGFRRGFRCLILGGPSRLTQIACRRVRFAPFDYGLAFFATRLWKFAYVPGGHGTPPFALARRPSRRLNYKGPPGDRATGDNPSVGTWDDMG